MVDQAIINLYNSIKFNHDARAIILTLDSSNQNTKLVEKCDNNCSYQDVIAKLSDDDVFFVVVRFECPKDELVEVLVEKLVFIHKQPETISIRRKIGAMACFTALRAEFTGLQLVLGPTDDLTFSTVRRKVLNN